MITIDRFEKICENKKIKDRLKEAGIFQGIGPTGPQGIPGPQGEIGPTGPQGESGLPYQALFSGFYNEANGNEIATFLNKRVFPTDSDVFITTDTDITIDKGVYELTLSGVITGADNDDGGIFYLYDVTSDTIVSGLYFLLNKGNTPEMYFSGVAIIAIDTPSTFQVKTELTGGGVKKVKFSGINIVLKKHNI